MPNNQIDDWQEVPIPAPNNAAKAVLDVFNPQEEPSDWREVTAPNPQAIPALANTTIPAAQNPTSFLGEMGANVDNAIQSGKDLLSGNFQDIGHTAPTPKTEALADKLFPKGSDGTVMGALRNVGNTVPSDYSGALLEKFGTTPEGKALNVLGGLNPVWNAASTATNRYVNPAIENATGIHPDNLALLEMGAGTLGVKKAGALNDPIISAVKKVSGSMGEGSGVSTNAALAGAPEYVGTRVAGAKARGPEALAEASKALRAEATPIYKAVDNAGGRINDSGIKVVLENIGDRLGPEDELLPGPTLSLFSKMKTAMQNGDISVTKLDKYRQRFSDIADDTRKSKIDGGGLTSEGRLAVEAIKGIDESLNNFDPSHFSKGGPEIIGTLNKARAASARSASFDRIMRVVNKAGGDPTKIKAAFTKLAENKNNFRGLSSDEIQTVKDAASSTFGERIERGLGTFGIDFGTRKNVALPGLGLAGAGGAAVAGASAPGVIPAVALGTVTRQLSKFAARGKADNVLKTIEQRGLPEQVTPAAEPSMSDIMKMKPADARAILDRMMRARRAAAN